SNNSSRVTRTKVGSFDSHGHQLIHGRTGRLAGCFWLHIRPLQWVAGQCRNFASDPNDTIQVRPVRRNLKVINNVAAGTAKVLSEGLSASSLLAQDQNAVDLIR